MMQITTTPTTVSTWTDGNNDRNSYRISGRYDGASGHYICTNLEDAGCSVQRVGNLQTLTGDWVFIVSQSATVLQDDTSFMHFGWWRRMNLGDGSLSFASFLRRDERGNVRRDPHLH